MFIGHMEELRWDAEHDVPFKWPASEDKVDWEFEEIDEIELGVLEVAMMYHWNYPEPPPRYPDGANGRGKRRQLFPVPHRSSLPQPLPFYNLQPPPNVNDANDAVALTSDEFIIPKHWFYEVVPKKKHTPLPHMKARRRNPVGWGFCVEERYSISWVVIVVLATLPTGAFGFALAWCIIHGPTFWGMSSAVTALFMMGFTLWLARMKDSK